jgi:hypothetical protein
LLNYGQAAVEALHSLYGRSNYDIKDFQDLVNLIYQTSNLALLQKLYQWSAVDVDSMLEPKYAICKKLSEVCFVWHPFTQKAMSANKYRSWCRISRGSWRRRTSTSPKALTFRTFSLF